MGSCRPFLGPGFRLAARWNRLGEPVKMRKKRGKTGEKWARYSLRSVGSEVSTRVGRARLSWLLSSIRRRWANPGGALHVVPPLTAEQDEALDLVAAIAEESCLQQRFELGDLQLSSK